MYFEELLKTYGLDPEIFKVSSTPTEDTPKDFQRETVTTDDTKEIQHEVSPEANIQSALELQLDDIPDPVYEGNLVYCLNCSYFTQKNEGEKIYGYCELKDMRIDNPEETSCSFYGN